MNHKRLLSLAIYWILVAVPGLSVQSFANNESETIIKAEQHFQKANELHILSYYDAAIAEYQAVISLSPNSKIAQNAQYWIGQLYFESKQFDAALSAFQKLYDGYSESRTIPATTLMIERVQQAKKNKSLFEAVKKADVEQVKLLIAEGADVDARDEKGMTPLFYAARYGRKEVAELLIAKGADVNVKEDRWGGTPLCWTTMGDHRDLAELLIANGANVNSKGHYGWTPLHDAAWFGARHVADLLLAKKADISAQAEKWAATPLHAAAYQGHKDVAELLIAKGADVNTKGIEGYTPLQCAAQKGITEVVQLLLEAGADVNAENNLGEEASLYAVWNNKPDILELLIAHGADVNEADRFAWSLLHYTAGKDGSGSTTMTRMLLDKGANPNVVERKRGLTPLHRAAGKGNRTRVELLLAKGAKIDAKDDESGFTALHHAAQFGNKNAAEVLIARGADINARDKQGHTPLYVAVNHDYKVAELLMNRGAESNIRSESGQTLLELAQERKLIESTVPDLIFDGEPNSGFGTRIVCGDVDGDGYDDILIGAMKYNNDRGRVYLFYGGPDMDTTADLILEGQNEGDWFGAPVVCGDIDNDGYEDIVIAAGQYNDRRGRAYLYWGSDRDSMDANPDKIFAGDIEKDSQFGGGHSAVYDIDNDGYDDIILGACAWSDKTGRAYLYYGNTKELMDTSHDLIFTGEKPRDFFGYTIGCGDVDNDGYGDIVIGGYARQGRAYLYYGGSKSNMDAKADVIFKAQSEDNEYFGCGIVFFDQNRDGYDDVVIGAPGYNDWQGRAYLFHGNSKRNLDTDPDMIFDGEVESSHYFGPVQVVCGDIDGDNVNDLVIGARRFRQRVGRVYVYWGKELAAPNPKPGRIFTGENPKDEFGYGLACGDVNNDGFDDLVIGAYQYKAGAKQGRAYLYYGGPKNK